MKLMTNYYIMYTIVDFFMIIFTVVILYRLGRYMGSEYEIKVIRGMFYCYLAAVAFDIIWVLAYSGIISDNAYLSASANMGYWISMSIGCYCWMLFVMSRLHPSFVYGRKLKIVITAPIILCCILDILSLKTGFIFSAGPGSNSGGSLFWLQDVIQYSYLLVPAVNALFCAVIARTRSQRVEYLTYSFSMLVPIAAAFVDAYLPMVTPIGIMSIFVVILILFLMIQNSQINNDALTQLNNRRRMDQYLEEKIGDATEKQPVTMFIMDVNRFKSINDTYGHVEGDEALKIVAVSLKKAAEKYNAFAARYGGDEFCLILSGTKYMPREIEEGVDKILQDAQKNRTDKGYTLTVSIGHAVCTDPLTDVGALIRLADEMLYRRKSEWYAKDIVQPK